MLLIIFVTLYGVVGALSGLFQYKKIKYNLSAEDISLRFLAIYYGGYWIWFFYGIIKLDPALIIVDLVGIIVVSITFFFALKIKIGEGGHSLGSALFDKSLSTRNPSLFANSSLESIGKKPPKQMSSIVYSRLYPLKMINQPVSLDNLLLNEISGLGQNDFEDLFFKSVSTWREVDCLRHPNWKEWRMMMLRISELLEEEEAPPATLELVSKELSRDEKAPPAPGRMSACRKATLFTIVSYLQKIYPNDISLPGLSNKLSHYNISPSEHRWLEQLLATYFLKESQLQTNDTLQKLSKTFPNWVKEKAYIADSSWSALLWPVQAGINDYWGNPNVLLHPVIKEKWLEENDETKIANALLKHARYRPEEIRYSSLHPIDYSLNNGWQALTIDEHIGERSYLFPVEKAFLIASCKEAGWRKDEITDKFFDIKIEHSCMELSRMIGLDIEHLIALYENNYRRIAKECLPIDNAVEKRRIEEMWRKTI